MDICGWKKSKGEEGTVTHTPLPKKESSRSKESREGVLEEGEGNKGPPI